VDCLGDGLPGTGPYEELNVPFAPARQPASGWKWTGCDQGAIASAATISTMSRHGTASTGSRSGVSQRL